MDKDNNVNPFGFATITLLTPDSTIIKGVSSNEDGTFSFTGINEGNYILSVSFMGYQTTGVALKQLAKSVDVGDIYIEVGGIELDEVTVTGRNVIQKIDRQILMPSQNQIERASDTYDLLNKMMISRLNVDVMNSSLSVSGGGTVQTRINGIPANNTEVSALLPEEIVRIEYIDDPGSRYNDNNLGAVINFITMRAKSGGQVAMFLKNSPTALFGENFVSFKYNQGKSEWGINYMNISKGGKSREEIMEEFNITNDNIIERTQDGTWGKHKYFINNIDLSYNLTTTDKYIFNVILRNNIYNSPYKDINNKIITNNDQQNPSYSQVYNKEHNYSPTLDIYFQRSLKHNQSLEFNIVGTYIDTKNNKEYKEYYVNADNPYVHNIYDVIGEKYSIMGEGMYSKEFEKIKLNGGLRHFQMKSENIYTGTNPTNSKMEQSESYGFIEMQGRINKFNYGVGAGVTRSWFKESDHSETHYVFNPSVRIGYAPHDNSFIRYSFNIKPSIPSLGSLTNVEQFIDTIQLVRGNPTLTTFKMYENILNFSFTKNNFQSNININYSYYDKPIMESVFSENGKIVIMDENQKSFQKLNIEPNISIRDVNIGNLPNFLSARAVVGYTTYRSKGLEYEHEDNDFYFGLNSFLYYKKLQLFIEYRKYQGNLFGETKRTGEDVTAFGLGYKQKRFSINLGILYPFTNNYKTEVERLSTISPYSKKNYRRELGQMVVLNLSYNFNFGRRYETKERRIKNVDTDAGILKTGR